MKLSKHGMLALVAILILTMTMGLVACKSSKKKTTGTTTPTAAARTTPTKQAAAGGVPEVSITAADYRYSAPASIAGGIVRINFKNLSPGENHQGQLVRLNAGTTFDQFKAALQTAKSDADVAALGTFAGGPGTGPNGTNSVVLDLQAGQYVLLCLIPSPTDGVPHAAKGMIQALEVTTAAAAQPQKPAADVSVGLTEFKITAPATVPAGETTFEATNNGTQAHEMVVLKLGQGLTAQAAANIILTPPATPPSGPPPFTFAGQVAGIAAGSSAETTVTLEAGTYGLLCFFTDPASGSPHAALGMLTSFTVQ